MQGHLRRHIWRPRSSHTKLRLARRDGSKTRRADGTGPASRDKQRERRCRTSTVTCRPDRLRRRNGAAIDAGLRAYMIRVYNYMAAGVALTGVVAMADLQRRGRHQRAGQHHRPDPVRAGDLRRPADDRAVPRHARHGVLPELPHQQAAGGTALALFMVYAGAARADAVVDLPGLHRRLDHPHLLHLGGLVRRAQPVRLHDAA